MKMINNYIKDELEMVNNIKIFITIMERNKLELEKEINLLREELLRSGEKVKQLEDELIRVKNQKQTRSMKDYYITK